MFQSHKTRFQYRAIAWIFTFLFLILACNYLKVTSTLGIGGSAVVESRDDRNRKLENVVIRHLLQTSADAECREIHNKSTVAEKCAFVKETEDCLMDDGFFEYNIFVYCKLGNLVPLAMVILFAWWLFCFTGLAVCADDFFCKSLVVISKTLRLSPNVAGVTFLAFGNGAPDLFSAIAAFQNIKAGEAGLGTGGLFGAGIFVTTVVIGTVAVIKPFSAMQRPFIRDVLFYVATVFWTFFVLWRGEIYRGETIGFVALYVAYVFIVVISSSIYKKMKKNENSIDNMCELKECFSYVNQSLNYSNGDVSANKTSFKHSPSIVNELYAEVKVADAVATVTKESDEISTGEINQDNLERRSELFNFLSAINPINNEEWSEMKWYGKVYEVWKSPIIFVISLTCPVVDYDVEESHNWNKYLQVIQTFVSPTVCLILLQYHDAKLGDVFPAYGLTLIMGAVGAILVVITSSTSKKPIYHWVFGYVGFVVSMVWIYCIANEIVNILKCFGVVFDISNAILGLTLLAWGNSIGDWIANSVMARQGFPRMAFSACFGAPFFNLSLGFGIPLLLNMIQNGKTVLQMNMTGVQLILAVFLLGSCLISLVIIPTLKFKIGKAYGFFLIVYYVVFLTIALLTETGVILKNWRPPRISKYT